VSALCKGGFMNCAGGTPRLPSADTPLREGKEHPVPAEHFSEGGEGLN